MIYAQPGTPSAIVSFKARYGNFIGGQFVEPVNGRMFTNISPVHGRVLCEVPRSDAADVELALDAAHAAKDKWGRTSPTERANILLKIAQRMEDNIEILARAETLDNGKPIRETMAADLPLAIDHFRYFAGCLRAQEGSIAEIDADTIAYHFHEPLGVVGQIIPWNFPLLMACWKLAPALPGAWGYLYLPALTVISLASVAMAPLGARVAHHTDTTRLERIFGVLLFGLAASMIHRAFSGG